MRQLFASIWPVDIFESASWPTNLKLFQLATVAAAAYENALTAAATMGVDKPIVLFAAPEYYFVKNIAPGGPGGHTWTLYDEDEKDQLLRELKAIAKRHYRMLLVPGSIAWRQQRQQGTYVQQGHTISHDGYNTTPIYYKKELHHVYDKKFDDGSCQQYTLDVAFVRGTGSQLFKVEGLRCGIEVCGDVIEENLKNEAQPASLDVEIYISATNPHNFTTQLDTVPVRDGGYFVHCDASVGNDNAMRRNGVWALQRGTGMHGLPQLITGSIDPWSMRPVRDDTSGIHLSGSSVLTLRVLGSANGHENSVRPRRNSLTGPPLPSLTTSGHTVTVPRQRAPSFTSGVTKTPPPVDLSLTVDLELRGEYGLGTHGLGPDTYSVEATVKLSVPKGSQASVDQHLVGFTVDHGIMTPTSATTDQTGIVTARATLQRSLKATIRATVKTAGNAHVDGTCEIVAMGSGSVTKMPSLKQLPHPHVPSWYLPM